MQMTGWKNLSSPLTTVGSMPLGPPMPNGDSLVVSQPLSLSLNASMARRGVGPAPGLFSTTMVTPIALIGRSGNWSCARTWAGRITGPVSVTPETLRRHAPAWSPTR